MRIWKVIIKFVYSIFKPKKGIEIEKIASQFSYKYVDVLPLIVESDIIYITGEYNFFWMLGFQCPCGCQSTINLNLLEETFPCWKYSIQNNSLITLSPSIRRVNGCESHFFIQKSLVVWCD